MPGPRHQSKRYLLKQRSLQKYTVGCSLGLVTIDKESSTIRLVHFSVQEYFRQQRKEIFPMGERTVTESYLLFDVFELEQDSSVRGGEGSEGDDMPTRVYGRRNAQVR
jgi:hypothetical protein